MRVIGRLLCFVDSINEWCARIGVFGVVLIVLIGSLEVVRRSIFDSPSGWAWQVNSQLLCLYILLAGGYTLLVNKHMRMDLFYARYPLRVKAVVDLVLSVFFFAFCAVLVWQLADMGWLSFVRREHDISGHPPLPVYPLRILLPVGIFLLLLQGVAQFIRNLATAMKGPG